MATLPLQRCESVECAKEFQPKREWQKFCCTKCRMDYANARRSVALKMLGQAEAAPIALMAGVATQPVYASVGAST